MWLTHIGPCSCFFQQFNLDHLKCYLYYLSNIILAPSIPQSQITVIQSVWRACRQLWVHFSPSLSDAEIRADQSRQNGRLLGECRLQDRCTNAKFIYLFVITHTTFDRISFGIDAVLNSSHVLVLSAIMPQHNIVNNVFSILPSLVQFSRPYDPPLSRTLFPIPLPYSPGHLVPHSRVQPLGLVPRNILKFFMTIAAF